MHIILISSSYLDCGTVRRNVKCLSICLLKGYTLCTPSFIVPCSSKKYGRGFPEIIDATPADGFSKNTGIQTNSLRWISKNRVISQYGRVSNRVLNELDKKVIELVPRYHKTLTQKDKEIDELKNKNNELQAKINELEEKLHQ